MIHGSLIVIRAKGGKVVTVGRNVQHLGIVVINEDRNTVEFPENSFKTGEDLNAEIEAAVDSEVDP